MAAVLPDRWAFYLDQSDRGETDKIYEDAYDDSNLITLSILDWWENQGLNYNGLAWYRTHFKAPPKEPGKRYKLWFGTVDESCWVYLNSQQVGENIYDFNTNPNAWFEPYSVDVTDQLKYGEENLVAVKVRDLAGMGGIYPGAFLLEENTK